jgi:hypothetical protein
MTAFLVRSHHSVVQHCQALLKAGGLSQEEEEKLRRLLRKASLEIEQLAHAAA